MKTDTIVVAIVIVLGLLSGCTAPPRIGPKVDERVAAGLETTDAARRPPAPDAKVQEALLPPLRMDVPKLPGAAAEPRFDLSVNSAPAGQVFMSIVSGTRYSVLVHPEVTGAITVNLKDVTVLEALEAIRDLYGYDYRLDGTRLFVHPLTMQTRVFRVNYLIGQRLGRSDVRVTSGSVADAAGAAGAPSSPGAPGAQPGASAAGPSTSSAVTDSSRIQTSTRNDFWEELRRTLAQIIKDDGGRSLVVNPQAGVVVVRAMPDELRQVDAYLRAIRASVERQVMLEAKIVEVTLSEQYQSGVNWALFSRSRRSAGTLINPGTQLGTTGANTNTTGNVTISGQAGPASAVAGTALGAVISSIPGGSLFGLAFQTDNFAALLQFLESQGTVQVLSSPRIATLNNQKAVLKVGTDEFFITNIAGGSTTTGTTVGGTTTFPTLTLRPFFSGVALDITPQIDEDSTIILHIHPSVSNVQQDDRTVNLGSVFGGQITLPLARSSVSETDSVVRAADGNIVAIGGLMKIDISDSRAGVPGMKDIPSVGGLFGSDRRGIVKKELVILIKPTVIQSDRDSAADVREARERVLNMGAPLASPARQGGAR